MATVMDLDRILQSQDPSEKKEVEWPRFDWINSIRFPTLPTPAIEVDPEISAWFAEKETAPVETRDAVLELLGETRRWGRRMFMLTAANVVLAFVSVALFIAH
jgi:hypothetical protein